jgi:hypothetical protein
MARVAAIATHAVATTDLPGLESGARVETPDGPVAVERIRPGMTVLADDGSRRMSCAGPTRAIACASAGPRR